MEYVVCKEAKSTICALTRCCSDGKDRFIRPEKDIHEGGRKILSDNTDFHYMCSDLSILCKDVVDYPIPEKTRQVSCLNVILF